MSYKLDTVNKFMEDLASKDPVPGGGGVAAIASGLASALASMVFNLSVGKKAYNELDEATKQLIAETHDFCKTEIPDFLSYVSKDADAFMTLMDAYKLPKESEEDIEIRNESINKGIHNAMMVPMNLCEKTVLLMEKILISAKYGNKNVISDAGVAVYMACAAIETCILNIKINLSFMKDENLTNDMMIKYKSLRLKASLLKDEIITIVEKKIDL